MNRRKLLSLLGVSPAILAGTVSEAAGKDKKKPAENSAPVDPKIIALSPKGTPPPVNRFPMAPRTITSLEGKTVYLVDTGFFGADLLLQQVQGWFQRNMPTVKAELRKKAGTYPEDDPKLWAEIKANASACIMAIGH